MNKKILGIKVGTILMAAISLLVASIIWFYVEYAKLAESQTATEAFVESQEVNHA